MKGIILAGGYGTRLYPITKAVSKHLLPVYDKPLIYYPLSVLMLAGIREILIISTKRDIPLYQNLLGNGKKLGLSFSYEMQENPAGIAEAFIIGEKFIGNDKVALILGDNIFYGHHFSNILSHVQLNHEGALIFGYFVRDPSAYGVVEFDDDNNVLSLEEKPKNPKSNYAIPGLYFYDNNVIDIAKRLVPSSRGELEITDINREYLKLGKLRVEVLGRGMAWLDAGTHDSLLEASNYISTIQKRQGMYIACIEEIAYNLSYINADQLKQLAQNLNNTEYGKYLLFISNISQD
jgi:glucose-1-phosphate thymidylyltransferase